MKRRIIGIDVGKNGGIVVYDTENNRLLECIKMPPTPKDLLDFLSIYKENSVCYLERVNGITGQSASASFVFGEGYGQLTMGLIACGIPTVTVSPQTWQKTLGLRNTDKLGKTEWKNILKKKAQQLFPYAKVTLATSDALLICEYAACYISHTSMEIAKKNYLELKKMNNGKFKKMQQMWPRTSGQ